MSQRKTNMRGPMGAGRMGAGEKAKDFKEAIKKMAMYMLRYKFRLLIMLICAIAGTTFTIIGPKILGKATTELFNGLVAKINGSGGINFGRIGEILIFLLCLYAVKRSVLFNSGIYYDRNFQRCQL